MNNFNSIPCTPGDALNAHLRGERVSRNGRVFIPGEPVSWTTPGAWEREVAGRAEGGRGE